MSGDHPPGTAELVAFVAARYGDRLTEEQLAALEERVADYREKGEALADVDLDNGDGPAGEFRAFRG